MLLYKCIKEQGGKTMKNYKKWLNLGLSLLMAFTLTACNTNNKNDLDPKKVIKDIEQKHENLNSATFDINMKMSITSSETSMEFPIHLTLETEKDDDFNVHGYTTLEMLGEKITVDQWFIDGVMYQTDSEGNKTYTNINFDDIKPQTNIINYSDISFESMNAVKQNKKIILTLRPSKDDFFKLMEKQISNNIESFETFEDSFQGQDIEINDIIVTINEDGYVESQTFGMSISTPDGTIKVSAKISISKYNSTQIEEIDTSEFIENSLPNFDF